MTSIRSRVMAALKAFWSPTAESSGFASNRMQRYEYGWAFYTNTVYNDLASYLRSTYSTGSQLYKYTKGLRNPITRWADFYVENTWGGMLDLEAGDGKDDPSALPILTEVEELRPAIAKIWQWSNWNAKRNLATLYSATMGDTFIVVVDRPAAKKCYMQVRRPSEFTDVEWDDFGHVKKAVIEYQAADENDRSYMYKQVIEHPSVWGGKTTRFTTYRDGSLYAYDENVQDGMRTAQWAVPYDFVPVVHVPFRDVGEGWGALGYAATLPKIDAANGLASLLMAQVGKTVNPAYIAYGIQSGDLTLDFTPQDEIPIFYVTRPPSEASLSPLTTNLDLASALQLLDSQLADVDQDLPELRLSEALRSGLSGEALGRASADVVSRVVAVRGNHDSGLVRAHQMAIAIAGASGYDKAFQGFDFNSFQQGRLDHGIGDRPILPKSSTEQIDTEGKRWTQVQQAVSSGVPLETALSEIMGWEDEDLSEMQERQQATFLVDNEQ